MTAFTNVQSVIDGITADVNSAVSAVSNEIAVLNGTVDLSDLQAAVAALVAIVPVQPSE